MFNVSFIVSQRVLPDALTLLRQITENFQVSPLINAENPEPVPAQSIQNGQTTPLPTFKRKKRRKTRGHRNYGTQGDRARLLLLQLDDQPFQTGEFIVNARQVGVSEPMVYNILGQAVKDGFLDRPTKGWYKRTGQPLVQPERIAL